MVDETTRALQKVPMTTLDDDAGVISTCGESILKLTTSKMSVDSLLKQEDYDRYIVMAELMSRSNTTCLIFIKRHY